MWFPMKKLFSDSYEICWREFVCTYIYKCAVTEIFKRYNLNRLLKLSLAIWLGFAFIYFLFLDVCPYIEFITYVQICWLQICCFCMWSYFFVVVAKNTQHWICKSSAHIYVMPHTEVTWSRTEGDLDTSCLAAWVPPASVREHQGLWHNTGSLQDL